jgi:hypothetical protein
MHNIINPFAHLQAIAPDYTIPPAALYLGLGGLIPFLFSLLMVMFFDIAGLEFLQMFILGYGAVILSFLGGVRWGDALYARDGDNNAEQTQLLSFSIIAPLVAWLALLVPFIFGLMMLITAFALQTWWDVQSALRQDIPVWYGRLRFGLGSAVTALLVLMLLTGFF